MESSPDAGERPFLELRGVTKVFGGVRAVENLDLFIGDRDMRCIIGPNGCGKSTLFNLITGYMAPSSGAIRWLGKSLIGQTLHEIARWGIVRKFQVPSVFPSLTVEANIRASLAASGSRASVASVSDLLMLVRLEGLRGANAGTLSHGQKQWLELAMILAVRPRLILLDEPVAGMTRSEKAETARLIAEIRSEHHVAVLLIEHDMDFVASLKCPITVMMMGQVIASGNFAEVRNDRRVSEAYLGTAYG